MKSFRSFLFSKLSVLNIANMSLKNYVSCISGIPYFEGPPDYDNKIDSSDFYDTYKNFDHYSNMKQSSCCSLEESTLSSEMWLIISLSILTIFCVTMIILGVIKGWFTVSHNSFRKFKSLERYAFQS